MMYIVYIIIKDCNDDTIILLLYNNFNQLFDNTL